MSSAEGILVGYDGSPGSEQALSWAAREARTRGTALTVCHVWTLGFTAPPDQVAVLDLARRSGQQVIADGLRHAREVMPPELVRAWLAEGQAANVLVRGRPRRRHGGSGRPGPWWGCEAVAGIG